MLVNLAKERRGRRHAPGFLAVEDYVVFREVGLRGRLPDGCPDPAWRGRNGERKALFVGCRGRAQPLVAYLKLEGGLTPAAFCSAGGRCLVRFTLPRPPGFELDLEAHAEKCADRHDDCEHPCARESRSHRKLRHALLTLGALDKAALWRGCTFWADDHAKTSTIRVWNALCTHLVGDDVLKGNA